PGDSAAAVAADALAGRQCAGAARNPHASGAVAGCSAIGFVLFYALLSFAASSGPSWLVAGTFLFTVIAGMLCAPLIYSDERRRIPRAAFAIGLLVFAGVLMMQLGHADGGLDAAGWFALGCLLVAA